MVYTLVLIENIVSIENKDIKVSLVVSYFNLKVIIEKQCLLFNYLYAFNKNLALGQLI